MNAPLNASSLLILAAAACFLIAVLDAIGASIVGPAAAWLAGGLLAVTLAKLA